MEEKKAAIAAKKAAKKAAEEADYDEVRASRRLPPSGEGCRRRERGTRSAVWWRGAAVR